MLEQAVKSLKEGRKPSLDKPLAAETEVELRLPRSCRKHTLPMCTYASTV